MIQSVNSFKLAEEIDKCSENLGICTDVLIEVNIGGEESKTGLDKSQLDELMSQMSRLRHIKVKGLMAIPPICDTKSEISAFFHNMFNLFIDIKQKKYDNVDMVYLSMGMSGDFETAIECGANMVRVGSAIFGARDYSQNK